MFGGLRAFVPGLSRLSPAYLSVSEAAGHVWDILGHGASVMRGIARGCVDVERDNVIRSRERPQNIVTMATEKA